VPQFCLIVESMVFVTDLFPSTKDCGGGGGGMGFSGVDTLISQPGLFNPFVNGVLAFDAIGGSGGGCGRLPSPLLRVIGCCSFSLFDESGGGGGGGGADFAPTVEHLTCGTKMEQRCDTNNTIVQVHRQIPVLDRLPVILMRPLGIVLHKGDIESPVNSS
jgi:hypothetical protein